MYASTSKDSTSARRDLIHRWRIFASIALSPAVLLICLATAALIVATIRLTPASPGGSALAGVLAVSTVVIAVLSSVVGGVISQRLDEANGKGILVTRGKSAIRGLKLLLLSISALQNRTATLLKRIETDSNVAFQALEEVIERCNTLEEEAVNAIEEWQDIIPEADITTQIGMISTLADQRALLSDQIARLQAELGDTKDRSAQDKEKLELTLREKEAALQAVTRDLRSKEAKLSTSPRTYPVSSYGGSIIADEAAKFMGISKPTTLESILGNSSMDSIMAKSGVDSIMGKSVLDAALGISSVDMFPGGQTHCAVCGTKRSIMIGQGLCPGCGIYS